MISLMTFSHPSSGCMKKVLNSLKDSFDQALQRDDVKAIVVTGQKGSFLVVLTLMLLVEFMKETDLAFDLSLSTLLGDNIYNFGELLAHPIAIRMDVMWGENARVEGQIWLLYPILFSLQVVKSSQKHMR
ncbi:hypothetical protein L1887_20532 [Cichorium endivia]|nr:hypothetical protein L1887_20532 [Cichorium endivia]